jgi:transcriptional regulator with XRE-family HTH domain
MKLRLAEVRKRRKVSQLQLSKKAGISRSYVSEMETGKYNPSLPMLCKICKILNCTPNDLIDCEDDD